LIDEIEIAIAELVKRHELLDQTIPTPDFRLDRYKGWPRWCLGQGSQRDQIICLDVNLAIIRDADASHQLWQPDRLDLTRDGPAPAERLVAGNPVGVRSALLGSILVDVKIDLA